MKLDISLFDSLATARAHLDHAFDVQNNPSDNIMDDAAAVMLTIEQCLDDLTFALTLIPHLDVLSLTTDVPNIRRMYRSTADDDDNKEIQS